MSTRKLARRWAPALILGLISGGSWVAAERADTDNISTESVAYGHELQTSMLSPRRMPRTLQVPIVDDKLTKDLQPIYAGLPATSCVAVTVNGRTIQPTLRSQLGLIPASNMKILSTWAALQRLDAGFRFRTVIRAEAAPVDGVIDGDVYFVGDGDPFLSTADWWSQYESAEGRFHTSLEELADSIVDAGVIEITGALTGDESAFDQVRQGPWADRLIAGKQSGPLSALTVNEGFTDWPAVHISQRDRTPTDNPPLHAASVLADLLAQRGVTIGSVAAGVASPTSGVEIAAIESPPLSDIITHVNALSSNIGAELLVKKLGQVIGEGGTTAAGTEVVKGTLEARGFQTAGLVLDDGSGLAESSRVTCDVLLGVLSDMGAESALGQSMAISGERGTLAMAFLETAAEHNLYAKTGTLNDAIALSGYVRSTVEPGLWLEFAYIANDTFIIGNEELDQRLPLVVTLAQYPKAPATESLLPAPPTPIP